LGPSWSYLGLSQGIGALGTRLAILGPSWGPTSAVLGPFWAILESSWGHLCHRGPCSGHLAQCWSHIGGVLAILGHLRFTEAILGRHLGTILGSFWGYLGPCRGEVEKRMGFQIRFINTLIFFRKIGESRIRLRQDGWENLIWRTSCAFWGVLAGF
jgi:hypothetical protein